MPPKKDKKKDKKKKDGDEDEILKENLEKSQREIEALQRLLVIRTEQAQRSKAEQEELAQRVKEFYSDFENEKQERFMITADMTRQYKTMQDELINRINHLEETIAELKDELDMSRIALETTRRDKDAIIQMKDNEIEEQKQKMEDMAIEFANMLKETLEKMNQRMENTSDPYEGTTNS